ncbi:MAG: hypothetical protein VKI82_13915 [Leptolyngbya sp.]|nr:hypothetical protein [Leptolyngbya sp.]
MIGIMAIGLGWGAPAQATAWTPVTPAGLEQQWIDTDSIQRLPDGTVQVSSLYINSRRSPPERITYLTEYRCQTEEFRDVASNGEPGDLTWHPVAGDPLNAQTLADVCARAEERDRKPE